MSSGKFLGLDMDAKCSGLSRIAQTRPILKIRFFNDHKNKILEPT